MVEYFKYKIDTIVIWDELPRRIICPFEITENKQFADYPLGTRLYIFEGVGAPVEEKEIIRKATVYCLRIKKLLMEQVKAKKSTQLYIEHTKKSGVNINHLKADILILKTKAKTKEKKWLVVNKGYEIEHNNAVSINGTGVFYKIDIDSNLPFSLVDGLGKKYIQL